MSEEKEFDKALENLKNSFAGKDGIIHLYEQGYSFSKIQSSLDYPFSMDRIGKTVWDHMVSEEIILLKAPGSGQGKANSTYVKTVGAYGKQSFVKVSDDSPVEKTIKYTKSILNIDHDIFSIAAGAKKGKVKDFLEANSKGGPDYVSLDFGRLKTRAGNEWVSVLSKLEGDERDYIEYLPWEKSIYNVYHKLDDRIINVLYVLETTGQLPGVFYFAINES